MGEPKEEAAPAWLEELMPLQEQMTELQNTLDKQISAAVLEHQKAVMPVYEARNNVVDKVPGFWLKALQGHPMLSQVLSEADVEILWSLIMVLAKKKRVNTKLNLTKSSGRKARGQPKNSNAKETKKGKKRPAEEEDEEQTDSIFDIFDAEKYGDDTLIEPLRELYMDAEGFYMADPSQFDMGGGCEDEDCDHTHH